MTNATTTLTSTDPTDTNLLYDAVRKVIATSAGRCADAGLSDWRQHAYITCAA